MVGVGLNDGGSRDAQRPLQRSKPFAHLGQFRLQPIHAIRERFGCRARDFPTVATCSAAINRLALANRF